LFKELEGQVEQDKAQKIQATLNKNPAQVVKPVQSTITATTKVSNVSVEDDLNKWLN
jgi:phage shock protein A